MRFGEPWLTDLRVVIFFFRTGIQFPVAAGGFKYPFPHNYQLLSTQVFFLLSIKFIFNFVEKHLITVSVQTLSSMLAKFVSSRIEFKWNEKFLCEALAEDSVASD